MYFPKDMSKQKKGQLLGLGPCMCPISKCIFPWCEKRRQIISPAFHGGGGGKKCKKWAGWDKRGLEYKRQFSPPRYDPSINNLCRSKCRNICYQRVPEPLSNIFLTAQFRTLRPLRASFFAQIRELVCEHIILYTIVEHYNAAF